MENKQEKTPKWSEEDRWAEETDKRLQLGSSARRGLGAGTIYRRRYFEGYTEKEVIGPDGVPVIRSVYAGYWYIQELDRRGRWLHRIAYFVSALLCAALIAFGAMRPIPVNSSLVCALPQVAAIFCMILVLYGVVNDCLAPQKRTIGDYRATSKIILTTSLIASIAGGVACLVTLIYAMVGGAAIGMHLLSAAFELIAAGFAFLIRWMEKNVKYTKELANPDEDEAE